MPLDVHPDGGQGRADGGAAHGDSGGGRRADEFICHRQRNTSASRRAQSVPDDVLRRSIVDDLAYMSLRLYGMTKHRHLFTNRQLVALDDVLRS